MIGGLRFDLNSDTEVQILWKNIPPSLDMFTHIYCEGIPYSPFGTQVSTMMKLDNPAKSTRSKTNLCDVPFNKSQASTVVNLGTPKNTTRSEKAVEAPYLDLNDSPTKNTKSVSKRKIVMDSTLMSSPSKC